MSALIDVAVWFPGSRAENFSATSVMAVARELLSRTFLPGEEPIRIQLVEENRYLIYDADTLRIYIRDLETMASLYEKLECDGVYRNTATLYCTQNKEIEKGSLWIRRGQRVLLFDADEFCAAAYNDIQFEEIV